MNDRAAFLRTICAHCEDDLPRLVYADWLEEHERTLECPQCEGRGEIRNIRWEDYDRCERCKGSCVISNGFADRGEFVRVQCKTAASPVCLFSKHDTCYERRASPKEVIASGCKQCKQHAELTAHADSLLNLHGEQWLRDEFALPEGWSVGGENWVGAIFAGVGHPELTVDFQWRRGFAWECVAYWDTWVQLHPFLTHPVERLNLLDWPAADWLNQRVPLSTNRDRYLIDVWQETVDKAFPGIKVAFPIPTEEEVWWDDEQRAN